MKCLFHDLFINIDLNYDAVRIFKYLISVIIQNSLDRAVIRSFDRVGG